jgi:hypothetical protein
VQISNNNLETAAQKFWETDPSNLKNLLNDSVSRWDETAFGSGRYGQDETSGGMPSTWDLKQDSSGSTWADNHDLSFQY